VSIGIVEHCEYFYLACIIVLANARTSRHCLQDLPRVLPMKTCTDNLSQALPLVGRKRLACTPANLSRTSIGWGQSIRMRHLGRDERHQPSTFASPLP